MLLLEPSDDRESVTVSQGREMIAHFLKFLFLGGNLGSFLLPSLTSSFILIDSDSEEVCMDWYM
jgi:hypothetical protein